MMAVIESGPLGVAEPGGEAFRLIAQARRIAQEAGAYQPVIKAVIFESHLLCGMGEYERAAAVAREGIADAERHGLARTRGAFLAINVAEPLLYLGRWDEALEVAERALDLAPPSSTRCSLSIPDRFDRARPRRHRHRRQARGRQPGDARRGQVRGPAHLPQAVLDIGLALVTEGPAAAVDAAAETLRQYDLSSSAPRYVWPVLVIAAAAARRAAGDAADALLCRLRTLAEKQDVDGPVQRAWQLSYAAIDPRPGDDTAGPASVAARLARGRRRRRGLGGHRPALPGRPRAGRRRSGGAVRRRVGTRGGRRPAAPRRADRGPPPRPPAGRRRSPPCCCGLPGRRRPAPSRSASA